MAKIKYECAHTYSTFILDRKKSCEKTPYYIWCEDGETQCENEPWLCKICGDYWLKQRPEWKGREIKKIKKLPTPKSKTKSWFDALPDTFKVKGVGK